MCWGVLAKVLKIDGLVAEVDFGGVKRQVVVGFEGIKERDIVVVHAGLIIGKIDEKSLIENLEFYKNLVAESLVNEGIPKEIALFEAEEKIMRLLKP